MTGDERSYEIYELFHENTKTGNVLSNEKPAERRYETDYTTFPAEDTYGRDGRSRSEIYEIIRERRSPTAFSRSPIEAERISQLLFEAVGITRLGPSESQHRRAYPSAGALYPVETYVVLLNVNDLPRDVYHYDVLHDRLTPLGIEIRRSSLDCIYDGRVASCAAVIFLTLEFERITAKYRSRGYRYALMEAGHMMQNLCLVSTSLGMSCLPVGGFLDDEASALLRLDGSEDVVYVGLVGQPRTRPDPRSE
jgi:SagB-type dehydrogenase family enzyme